MVCMMERSTMNDDSRPLLPVDQQVWLEGPVELIDGKLTLAIPLDQGGDRLQTSAKGISYVANDCLNVVIPDWLAEDIGVTEGMRVQIDNRDGRFNITKVNQK